MQNRAEKMLRDTWGMVESGVWNKLDQGRPEAVLLPEQRVMGM